MARRMKKSMKKSAMKEKGKKGGLNFMKEMMEKTGSKGKKTYKRK